LMYMTVVTGLVMLGAMVSSAALVIDYDYTSATANSTKRLVDVDTTTGDTWDFSDTVALIPNPTAQGQNATIYGGIKTSWDPAGAYDPAVLNVSSTDRLRVAVNPDGDENSTSAEGMFIWKKADFLNGGSSLQMGFGAGDAMSISFATITATDRQFRFVVKSGGVYYVNNLNHSAAGAGSFSITPQTQSGWAPISTDGNYTIGTFEGTQFADIEAVGFYFKYGRTLAGGTSPTILEISDFQVNASVVPEPATIGLFVIGSVGALIVRRQGIR